jgi:hypothetical protein
VSDASVHEALRSKARLVVVEAPGGCGKTYQGALYTEDVGEQIIEGRLLILTHTHAAREVFHSRTNACRARVEIRTIDSLLAEIAEAYRTVLGFPEDVGMWALQNDGFLVVAEKVSLLLQANRAIVHAVVARNPLIICDEHQDANVHQETIILLCQQAGASVRIFGDPRQRIYSKGAQALLDAQRWEALKQRADRFEVLDTPHRWENGNEALGKWILDQRHGLWEDGTVDLRPPRPAAVKVLFAENQALRFGGYRVTPEECKPIWTAISRSQSLLMLSYYNPTVSSLRGIFAKVLPVWEGHVRDHLHDLVTAMEKEAGSPDAVATAAVTFTQNVVTGFSNTTFANALLRDVRSGCSGKKTGKAANVRELAKCLHTQPNHVGVALFLRSLHQLAQSDKDFASVRLDAQREFWDAASLGNFANPRDGLAELARRRAAMRHTMPKKALATIHKAKGLECSDVVIIPCDQTHFKDSEEARCALYVAISRATESLTFVVSRDKPSPLLRV